MVIVKTSAAPSADKFSTVDRQRETNVELEVWSKRDGKGSAAVRAPKEP
jgi:hypothetical protein